MLFGDRNNIRYAVNNKSYRNFACRYYYYAGAVIEGYFLLAESASYVDYGDYLTADIDLLLNKGVEKETELQDLRNQQKRWTIPIRKSCFNYCKI